MYKHQIHISSQIVYFSYLIIKQFWLQFFQLNWWSVLCVIIITFRLIELMILRCNLKVNAVVINLNYILIQLASIELMFNDSLCLIDIQLITLSLILNQVSCVDEYRIKNHLIIILYMPIMAILRVIIYLFYHNDYIQIASLVMIANYIVLNLQFNQTQILIKTDQASQWDSGNLKSMIKIKKMVQQKSKNYKQSTLYKKWQSCNNNYSDELGIEVESSLQKSKVHSFKNLIVKEELQQKERSSSQAMFPKSQLRKKSQGASLMTINDNQDPSQLQKSLFNLFPAGIVIINQQKVIVFANNKCEKLLECSSDQLLTHIQKAIQHSNIHHREQKKFNYLQQQVQEHIRSAQINDQDFDIFDYLFTSFRGPKFIHPNSSSAEVHEVQDLPSNFSCLEQQQQQIKLFYSFDSRQRNGKQQLEFQITLNSLHTQSEQISIHNLNRQQSLNRPSISEQSQNYIFILIKNVTTKSNYTQLKHEMQFSNRLLKSFSHELRTPLNCSIQMLQIAKELLSNSQVSYFIQQALISNQLLIYQINDILDYSALQCNSFSYQLKLIFLEEIYNEIMNLFQDACDSKNISFIGKFDRNLKYTQIKTDKNRIIQILVNLFNNSIKYTPQNGSIQFIIKQNKDFQTIRISVKDSGIGIEQKKLENIKRITENLKLKPDDLFQKHIGLGITISSRISQGLTVNQENILRVKSEAFQGTKVSFDIQHIRRNVYSNYKIQLSATPKNSNFQELRSLDENNPKHSGFELNQDMPRAYTSNNQDMPMPKCQTFLNPSHQQYSSNLELEEIEFSDYPNVERKLPHNQTLFFQNFKKDNFQAFSSLAQQNSMQSIDRKKFCSCCTNVLLVDDVPFNQMAFKAMLNHYKIQVDQAFDGYQALRIVKDKMNDHCNSYKLIFMDIEMPGMDGFKTSREVQTVLILLKIFQLVQQNQLERPFIIMCSAYDTSENYDKAKQVGMIDFLPKPIRKVDLEKKINKYIEPQSL